MDLLLLRLVAGLEIFLPALGGGALAGELQKETARGVAEAQRQGGEGKDTAVELLKVFGSAAGEIDRIAFEEQCLSFGRGERPAVFNDKARAFFAVGGNVDDCEAAATRALKIAALERELGVAPTP